MGRPDAFATGPPYCPSDEEDVLKRVDDSKPAVVLLRTHVLGVDGVTAERPGGRENDRVPIGKAEAPPYRNRIPEHAECHVLDSHFQHRLEEAHGVVVGESTGSGDASRLVVELLNNLHGYGEIRLAQELPRANTLGLFFRENARRVEQHVRVDEAHAGWSAVVLGPAGRICLETGRGAVVDGLPREIVGHAQPNPTRVKVGEDLVKQPAPALKRGFEALRLLSLAPAGAWRETPQELSHKRRHRRVQLRRPDAGAAMSLVVNGYGDASHHDTISQFLCHTV